MADSIGSADVKITADQFLEQADATLAELAALPDQTAARLLIIKSRELILGAYYAMKAHEYAISDAHDRITRLETHIGDVFRTNGLRGLAQQSAARKRGISAETHVVTAGAGEGDGGGGGGGFGGGGKA